MTRSRCELRMCVIIKTYIYNTRDLVPSYWVSLYIECTLVTDRTFIDLILEIIQLKETNQNYKKTAVDFSTMLVFLCVWLFFSSSVALNLDISNSIYAHIHMHIMFQSKTTLYYGRLFYSEEINRTLVLMSNKFSLLMYFNQMQYGLAFETEKWCERTYRTLNLHYQAQYAQKKVIFNGWKFRR